MCLYYKLSLCGDVPKSLLHLASLFLFPTFVCTTVCLTLYRHHRRRKDKWLEAFFRMWFDCIHYSLQTIFMFPLGRISLQIDLNLNELLMLHHPVNLINYQYS